MENRVLTELISWEENEKILKKHFPMETTKVRYQKSKLNFLDSLKLKYTVASPEEKVTLELVQDRIGSIEKQLYRNFFELQFYKAIRHRALSDQQKNEDANFERSIIGIKETVVQLGLPERAVEIIALQRYNSILSAVPVEMGLERGNDMKYLLELSRLPDGQIIIPAYQAELSQNGQRVAKARFSLDQDAPTAYQAYAVLSGNSIFLASSKQWLNIDPNSVDQNGNMKVRAYSSQVALAVEEKLSSLPLKNKGAELINTIATDLHQFGSAMIVLDIDGKEYLRQAKASPAEGKINIFSDKGVLVSAKDRFLSPAENMAKGFALMRQQENHFNVKVSKGLKVS